MDRDRERDTERERPHWLAKTDDYIEKESRTDRQEDTTYVHKSKTE